jgi:hypothetical protein
MIEGQQAEAQQVLDELFRERLIPFELCAQRVEAIGTQKYIIRFWDSRLHSVGFSWRQGESFTEAFRAAVLDRVKRLSGPLYGHYGHMAFSHL